MQDNESQLYFKMLSAKFLPRMQSFKMHCGYSLTIGSLDAAGVCPCLSPLYAAFDICGLTWGRAVLAHPKSELQFPLPHKRESQHLCFQNVQY